MEGPQAASTVVRVLASGSSGNAIFVRLGEVRFLVDAGISCRRICDGLAELGEDAEALTGILLTHEHSDHIQGLGTFRRRFPEVPVFATAGTARAVQARRTEVGEAPRLLAGWPVKFGPVTVTPFAVRHDAAEPVGFRIETAEFAMAIATDLGRPTSDVRHGLFDCQLLVLEANHDLDMLHHGPYPEHLRRRIASAIGHLSNEQTRRLLREVAGPRLERVVLGHISADNNDPALALDTVAPALDGCSGARLEAASRTEAGEPMTFVATQPSGRPKPPPRPPRQCTLPFF